MLCEVVINHCLRGCGASARSWVFSRQGGFWRRLVTLLLGAVQKPGGALACFCRNVEYVLADVLVRLEMDAEEYVQVM